MLDLPVLSVMALIHPDQQTNNIHPLLLERLLVMCTSSVQLYCILSPHSFSSLSAQVQIRHGWGWLGWGEGTPLPGCNGFLPKQIDISTPCSHVCAPATREVETSFCDVTQDTHETFLMMMINQIAIDYVVIWMKIDNIISFQICLTPVAVYCCVVLVCTHDTCGDFKAVQLTGIGERK